jgi:putative hydrolase of the HAD superfamily
VTTTWVETPIAYSAVIFDLFGTLVGNFSAAAYNQVIAQMAAALSTPYDPLYQRMGLAYRDREIGKFASVEESFACVCRALLLREVTSAQVEHLAQLHYDFVARILVPDPGVLETLGALKSRGLRLGLISNCGPDVPRLWAASPLSRLIDGALFSSQVGMRKPDPRMYATAAARLGVPAEACVYVGDGSYEELRGEAQIGMHPVLKRVDLGDVYDPNRDEVKRWKGTAITTIAEIIGFIESAGPAV